jgi:hypothetical protein
MASLQPLCADEPATLIDRLGQTRAITIEAILDADSERYELRGFDSITTAAEANIIVTHQGRGCFLNNESHNFQFLLIGQKLKNI